MKHCQGVIIIIILIWYNLSVLAQHQSMDLNAGLHVQGKINAFVGLTCDQELLISSLKGWVKYNGLNTKSYDINSIPGLLDQNIQSEFLNHSDCSIWFATYMSLVRFDSQKEQISQIQLIKNGIKLTSDYYIFHLEEDIIYGCVGKELFIYDIVSGKTQFPGVKFKNNWNKLFIIENKIHIINYYWGNTTSHYIFLKSDFCDFYQNHLPFRTDDIAQMNNPEILLATETGIRKYNLLSSKTEVYFPQFSNNHIHAICNIGHGKYVISTKLGEIFIISETEISKIQGLIPENPPVQHIEYLDGKIIMSSYGHGVYIFNSNILHFRNVPFPSKYNLSQINSIGQNWIMTSYYEMPLIYYSHKAQFTVLNSALFSGMKHCSKTNYGLLFTSYPQRKQYSINDKMEVTEVTHSNHASPVYSSNYHSKLRLYSTSTMDGKIYFGVIKDTCFSLTDSVVWNDRYKGIGEVIYNEGLLIASVNHEYCIQYERIENSFVFRKRMNIKGEIYGDVWDAGRNSTWLATQYGLYKIDHGSLNNYLIDLDISGEINAVLMDKLNRIWFSTANGLFVYVPETNFLKRFGKEDGIADIEFKNCSAHKDSDGTFIFGSNTGLVYFKPEEVLLDEEPHRIKFNQILINDTESIDISNTKLLKLPYYESTVSFDFAALSLLNASFNKLKYRLLPEDEEFLETDRATGFARYSKLRPGKYEFQILAAGANNVWDTTPYTLPIIITPPFWQRWWFRIPAALLITLIIYSIVKAYYKNQLDKKDRLLREQKLIIEKQEAVQNERTRIAAEMHDDLGSGLTTIKYLSDKAMRNVTDPEEIVNIQQISEESNELVRNMSEIIWAMNARFDTLENLIIYIRRFAYEFLDQHQIAFELKIPDEIPDMKISGEKRRNIFLVVKEALHNVVKHSGSPTATVSVEFDTDLKISIYDQGASEEDNLNENHGNGLYNMKQRMKKIGGTCTFKNGSGWTVMLSLPLEALHH